MNWGIDKGYEKIKHVRYVILIIRQDIFWNYIIFHREYKNNDNYKMDIWDVSDKWIPASDNAVSSVCVNWTDARFTIDNKVTLIKRWGVAEATPYRVFLPVMITTVVEEKMVNGVGGMAHDRVRLIRRKRRKERHRCVLYELYNNSDQ